MKNYLPFSTLIISLPDNANDKEKEKDKDKDKE